MRKKSNMKSVAFRRSLAGYLFTLPFTLGLLCVFLSAFVLYITLAFKNTYPTSEGLIMDNVGLENFNTVLFVESGYINNVLASIRDIALICPMIVLFSFFIAIILNQNFRGRTVIRVLFFLPVLVSSGFTAMQSNDMLTNSISVFLNTSGRPGSQNLIQTAVGLISTSLPFDSMDIIALMIGMIYKIIMYSGVQIVIFLAGLQTIPRSLYESSSIEGASGWENFWKITLPMISPLMIVNIVYTIIDQMAGSENTVINDIYKVGMIEGKLGQAAAMGMMYLLAAFAILGIVISVINKFVFYEN